MFACLVAVLLGPLGAVAQQPVTSAAVDDVLKEAQRSWQAPGLAVAIVQNDRLVYVKGFGVKRLGKPETVSPDTVFPIASCSKAFTTLAMAMLVDEGKMSWDDPVRKHVPFFRLSDPLADANVTLRDLVCHRTGVGSHDLLWYRAPWGQEEMIRKIGRVPLQHSFRSTLQYQSILFGTAGYAVGTASRSSWHEFVQRRIFAPLEMNTACCTSTEARRTADHAQPHRKNEQGRVEAIPWYALDKPDPAGSIHASVRDLAKFLRFQLGDGTWQGQRLVSAVNLAEPHTPQIPVRREGFARIMNPATRQISYGMGWIIQDYRGQHILMHGGAIDGFRAHFTLVPQAKLGIVLVNNLDRTQLNLAASNTLIDLFLNLPYKDWTSYYAEIQRIEEKQQKESVDALWAQQHRNTKSSRELAAYVGTFDEPAYGTARVTLEDGKLLWSWGSLRCPLKHYHYDTFLAHDPPTLIHAPIVFSLGRDGEVATMQALEQTFRRVK
jgi:CubicO group peptidase (beta-lactamase class C family)